jgi:hypothetical protein
VPIPHRDRHQPRALSQAERHAILDVLHSDRFVDMAPAEVWATLLDLHVLPAASENALPPFTGGQVVAGSNPVTQTLSPRHLSPRHCHPDSSSEVVFPASDRLAVPSGNFRPCKTRTDAQIVHIAHDVWSPSGPHERRSRVCRPRPMAQDGGHRRSHGAHRIARWASYCWPCDLSVLYQVAPTANEADLRIAATLLDGTVSAALDRVQILRDEAKFSYFTFNKTEATSWDTFEKLISALK